MFYQSQDIVLADHMRRPDRIRGSEPWRRHAAPRDHATEAGLEVTLVCRVMNRVVFSPKQQGWVYCLQVSPSSRIESPHSEFPLFIYYCAYCWRFIAGSCFERCSALTPNPTTWLSIICESLAWWICVVSWEKWGKLNKHQSGVWPVVRLQPIPRLFFNQTTKTNLFGFLIHCLSESYCKDVQNIGK